MSEIDFERQVEDTLAEIAILLGKGGLGKGPCSEKGLRSTPETAEEESLAEPDPHLLTVPGVDSLSTVAGGGHFEKALCDLLRVMLQKWLSENLEDLVTQLVERKLTLRVTNPVGFNPVTPTQDATPAPLPPHRELGGGLIGAMVSNRRMADRTSGTLREGLHLNLAKLHV